MTSDRGAMIVWVSWASAALAPRKGFHSAWFKGNMKVITHEQKGENTSLTQKQAPGTSE